MRLPLPTLCENFNSTMVRLKADYAENNKGAKDISIPLWYD